VSRPTTTSPANVLLYAFNPHSPDGAAILLRCRGDSDRIINRLTWIVRGRHGEPNG
jgi:hypothetical protein